MKPSALPADQVQRIKEIAHEVIDLLCKRCGTKREILAVAIAVCGACINEQLSTSVMPHAVGKLRSALKAAALVVFDPGETR
jgi:hypothetical protein